MNPTFPRSIHLFIAAMFALAGNTALAQQGAALNYLQYCSGCHQPDGSGSLANRVPKLPGSLGHFGRSDAGRAFLIQIAGVAQAPLDDEQLAGLMNWVLEKFGRPELPAEFAPYTGSEVAALRAVRPADMTAIRGEIVGELAKKGFTLAPY